MTEENKPFPVLWWFDVNHRVYQKDGIKYNSPIYEEHFRPIEIIGENQKEYLCSYGTVNKKSRMYKRGRTDSFKTYTDEEKDDLSFATTYKYKASEAVRNLSVDNLRKLVEFLAQLGVTL